MATPIKILMLEDSPTDAELVQWSLKHAGHNSEFRVVNSRDAFIHEVGQYDPDIVLADNSLPGFDATDAVIRLRQMDPYMPLIVVTGTMSEEYAANVIKSGADDYILKDRLTRLPAAIDAAIAHRKMERKAAQAQIKLKASEEKYRQFMGRISDGFISLDTRLNVMFINHAAAHMLGLTPDKMQGRNLNDLFPEAVKGPVHSKLIKALASGKNIHAEEY